MKINFESVGSNGIFEFWSRQNHFIRKDENRILLWNMWYFVRIITIDNIWDIVTLSSQIIPWFLTCKRKSIILCCNVLTKIGIPLFPNGKILLVGSKSCSIGIEGWWDANLLRPGETSRGSSRVCFLAKNQLNCSLAQPLLNSK